MTSQTNDLPDLGWSHFFSSQLSSEEIDHYVSARVTAVHRGALTVAAPGLERQVPAYMAHATGEEELPTVGDWLLLDRETYLPRRRLERKSLFKRRAPGTGRKLQLIAANVDTVFIVSSCNQDFNLARLERYLVLAREAGVNPVVALTKADLAEDPGGFAAEARQIQPGLLVEVVDARDEENVACLLPWCGRGQTVALLGSSGVGKSTLVNTLTGRADIATQAIREDDAKGRHTTTARALHPLPQGGWLMDTPGMRELQLTDAAAGLEDVFAEIHDLARNCRFADCAHETEPGCAVQAAVAAAELDPARLKRWRKLAAEERLNRESLAERRARERAFGKMVRSAIKKGG